LDTDRIKNLTYSIDDVERWDIKSELKQEKLDRGFTDFAQIASKKYKKMISEFNPNIAAYELQKEELQDNASIYRTAHSTHFANPDSQPSKQSLDRLVKDIDKQNLRRGQFSRRRAFNEDEDVTYINERNMRFNKKISRAYDEYTKEIKQNFERGTAL
jgi:pre-mRNA-splicing factor SYF2